MRQAPDDLMSKLETWLDLAADYLAWESWWKRRRARVQVRRLRTGRGGRRRSPWTS